jgi:hypothetical protein
MDLAGAQTSTRLTKDRATAAAGSVSARTLRAYRRFDLQLSLLSNRADFDPEGYVDGLRIVLWPAGEQL